MAVTLGDIAMGNGRHNEFHQFGADDVNKAIYAGQTLGDLAERNRERARQQSVRNLIGQRMKEGYDWTQLGAEAAQFSPEMARTMDNQFMQEGTWQRNENVENLKQFREEMTRRKFSEALNTFMQGGYAISREEFMTMCQSAAANVAMYDAKLAEELLIWIRQMLETGFKEDSKMQLANAKKKQGTRRDDHKNLTDIKMKAIEISNNTQDSSTKAILNAEVSRIDKLENTLAAEGYPVYTWMLGFLMKNWDRESGYDNAIQKLRDSYDPSREIGFEYDVQGLDKSSKNFDNLASITGYNANAEQAPVNSALPSTEENGASYAKANQTANVGPKPVVSNSSSSGNSGKYVYTRTAKGRTGSNQELVDSKENIFARISQDIDELSSTSDANKLSGALDLVAGSDGKPDVSSLRKAFDAKRADLKELESYAVGKISPAQLKELKDLVGSRNMNSVLVRPLRNFASAMSTYINTNTPWTALANWILVSQPDYKFNKEDVDAAKVVITNSTSKNVKNIVASMLPEEIGTRMIADDAMYAVAMDGVNAMRTWFKGITTGEDGKPMSREEIQKLKAYYSRLFGIDEMVWDYIDDTDPNRRALRVPDPKERYKLKKKHDSEEMKREIERNENSEGNSPNPTSFGKKGIREISIQDAYNALQ